MALQDRHMGYPGYGYGGYGYPYHKRDGAATTAIGLSAGLGGAALIGMGLVAWGVNAASKARSRAAEKLSDSNARTAELLAQKNADNISALTNALLAERNSREDWQRRNQPTMTQYVDVQTNPNLNAQVQDIVTATASAMARAEANSGINSAVGSDPYVRVQLYGAPQPCNCPGSCGGY